MPFNLFGDYVSPPDPSSAQTSNRPIKVREVKRKKALLTCVFNLPLSQEEKKQLFKELKKTLACGGSIKEGVIELQGSKVKEVQVCLKERGFKVHDG